MAGIVIADAGPLIAFAGIDELPILPALFSQISVADSVRSECMAKPGIDAQRIATAIDEGWLRVFTIDNQLGSLSAGLGVGESDSIRFALDAKQESLLILDDRLARRYALKLGLNIIGTVRLLKLAQQRGLIGSAEMSIKQMAANGYRISVELLKLV